MHEMMKSTAPGYITGLAYDLHRKELFYVDQHQGRIGKINYDGTSNTVLTSNLTRPVGLSFFENHLYFLISGGFMGKCRLYAPVVCDTFKLNKYSTDLFALDQQSRQPSGENVCANHNCTHMCVASRMHYKCLCEDGKLVKEGEECGETKVGKRHEGFGTEKKTFSASRMVRIEGRCRSSTDTAPTTLVRIWVPR